MCVHHDGQHLFAIFPQMQLKPCVLLQNLENVSFAGHPLLVFRPERTLLCSVVLMALTFTIKECRFRRFGLRESWHSRASG
jgi:hypothetical protein